MNTYHFGRNVSPTYMSNYNFNFAVAQHIRALHFWGILKAFQVVNEVWTLKPSFTVRREVWCPSSIDFYGWNPNKWDESHEEEWQQESDSELEEDFIMYRGREWVAG
jgi:hypothetical protein